MAEEIDAWTWVPTPKSSSQGKPLPMQPESIGPAIDSDEYDMNHAERGLALIFNHSKFANGESNRSGAEHDLWNLKQTFTKLGFQMRILENLTKDGVLDTLSKVAAEDHSARDCLVIVMMTHGDQKEVSAYDRSYSIEKLWKPFYGDKCPSLVAKPKLFFIQACRGAAIDSGVSVKTRGTMIDSAIVSSYVIPSMADILLSYATFDGHYAWRNAAKGSWFIQVLCSELDKHADRKELLQILTRVHRRVATEYFSNVPTNPGMHLKKQMPNFMSSLTREVYFKTKPKTRS